MSKLAVIRTGGKQHVVREGDNIRVEKLDAEEQKEHVIDDVLLVAHDEKVSVGMPVVKGASVSAIVVKHGKGKKVDVVKYKNKTRQLSRRGHRQPYTELQIKEIIV